MVHPVVGPLSPDARLRAEVVDRLLGGHASVSPDVAFAGVPHARVNERPAGFTHSLWDLLWHVGFAQADIMRFCVEQDYVAPAWPDAYWPRHEADADDWDKSLEVYFADRSELVALVENLAVDITAEFAHAPGYTLLREALLAAEHAAYHIGQVVSHRRALGIWPPPDESGDGVVP